MASLSPLKVSLADSWHGWMCRNLRTSSREGMWRSLTSFSCYWYSTLEVWAEAGIPSLPSGAASKGSDLPNNWTDHKGAFAEFPREHFKAPNDFYGYNLPWIFPVKNCLLFIFSWQVGSVSIILVILLHLYPRSKNCGCLGNYVAGFFLFL